MARFQGPSRFRGPVTPTAPQDTGSLAGDIGRSAIQGAAGFGTSLANLANLATGGAVDTGFKGITGLVDRALGGPGEGRTLAQAYRDTSNTLQGSMSSETQRQQADVQREIGEADSAVGEFGAAALGYLSRPRLLAQQVTQSLPYMLGPMSLSTLATTQAGRIGANVAGSGLIGGGVAAIEAQGDVMEQPQEVLEQSPGYQDRIAMGMTPAQARESLARRSGGIAAGVAGPVSALAGALGAGVETRALAGGLGARAIPGAIAREAAEEAIQEPSEVVGQNIAARDRGEDVDVFEGAPAASGAGAVVGGVFGGSLATLSAAAQRAPGTTQPEQGADQPASDTDQADTGSSTGQSQTPAPDTQSIAAPSPEAIAEAGAILADPARLAALPEELRNLEAPALAEALASTQPPADSLAGTSSEDLQGAAESTTTPPTDQSAEIQTTEQPPLDQPGSPTADRQESQPLDGQDLSSPQQPPVDATPDNTTADISTAEAPYLSDEGAKTQTVEVIEGQDASVPGVPRLVDPTEVEADRFSQELDAYAERFGLSEEAKAAAQQAFSREPMRDTVTGFYMAQDRVPTIERAKQAVRDGHQALYFEMDIRNLGGLNKRFGHTEANTVYKRFSDAANEVLAGTGARVVPFRHGGDEISAVVVGVDPAQAETIAQAIEARSQEIAQELGIADIEHAKPGMGPGTGLYAGWSVIDPDADIATITSRADQRVEAKKVEYGQTIEAAGAGQAQSAGAQGEATGDAAPDAGGRAEADQEIVASASKAAAMRQFKTRTKSRSDAKKIASRTALYERDGQYYRSDSVDDMTALPAQGWTLVEAGEALTKKASRTQKGRASSVDPLSLSDANLNQLAAAMGIAPQSSRATISREIESRPAAEIEAAYRKAFQSFDLAQPDGGMSAAELQEVIAPYLARWRNAPDVEIVETAEGLPAEAKAEQGYGRARGAIISVDGASRVYLVAGNIPNADRALKTLTHEVLGHYGVEGLLPAEFAQIAQQINRLRDTNNKALREVFDDVESRYPGASDETFAAEAVAVAAERGIDIPVIRRLLASLRAFLRDTLGIPLEFSANELRAMLADTLRKSDAALTGDTVTPWNRGVDIQPARPAEGAQNVGDIRFDRIGDLRDLLSDIRSRRQSERRSPTQFIKDLSANTRPAWMNLLSRQQLVEIGSDILPSAARFEQFAREMDAITNRENDRYYPIARKWTDMAYGFNARLRRGVQAMSRIMEEATIMRYDPDNWDVMRDGPPPPGAGELRQRYEALPSEVKQLYREVRDAYSSRRDDMQEALIERIMASEAPPAVRQDFADRLRIEMEAGKINPYFPLSRFGDWFVVGRKGDERVFYLAESEQEQRLIARNVAADGYDVEVGKQAANLYQRVAPNEQFIGEVAKLISGGQVDPSDPMIDELYQMYLRQLPESSVRKHFIHRKGIVGASKDQLRAFSTQMGRGSKQLGRLKTGYQMQRSLTAMQGEAAVSADPNRAQDIINQLQESFQWMMNPTNATWANRLTSLGFAFYLGVSPAAALVNATQLAVITFPTLAARYGWRTASRVLSKRMAQVAGMTAAELGRDQPSQMRQRISAEYNGDMGKMLEQLEHDGTISRTQTMALAGLSEQDALGLANPILEKTMRGIGYLFQKAEVYNREATAIAAYELDRAAGKDHETAVQAAKNAVWQTHYDYSSGNRAKIMRGNTQRVLFLFKQYSQNTAYLLMRGFYNSFNGATPEEKRFARQQMMGIFGMTGVLAGATGLPLYGSIMAVAQILANIYDDDDDEIDVDVEFRNFLNDALGDTAGQIMQTGFANQLTGLDISARTSLANLFVRPPSRDLEGRDLSAYWLEQAAGPVAGIAINWTRAAQLLNDGELYRGVETAIPKFMRDVMKAGRYTDEGVLNMRGDPIVQELNAWQIIGQANGFTPAEVSEQYERNNAVKNAEQRILDRRRSLANGYWLAMSAQDTEAMQDVIRKIAAFNRAQPAVAITGETLKRSIQSRQNASTRSLSGVNVNPNLQPQLERAVRF